MDNASPGNIIKVQPGTYNENVSISTDHIHLVGQGAATAVVNAGNALNGIEITQSVEGVSIANFRFTNAVSSGGGSYAGVIIYGSSPDPRGLEICNNVFVGNELGVAAQNATSPVIVNNDFVNNIDAGVSTGTGSTAIVRNNLFQGNADGIRSSSANVVIDYNLFFDNTQNFGGAATCDAGDGCLFGSDPLLANISGNDFHLSSGSPAIDTATGVLAPAADFDPENRPQAAATDIGADEFVAGGPTPSPTPTPTATSTPAAVPGVSETGTGLMIALFAAALALMVGFRREDIVRSRWRTPRGHRIGSHLMSPKKTERLTSVIGSFGESSTLHERSVAHSTSAACHKLVLTGRVQD